MAAYGLDLTFPRSSGSLSNLFYFGECYEWAEINFIRRYLKPGDLVVDVGANVGLFTYASYQCIGPAGRVHAIEPVPWAARTIEENATNNEISHSIKVHQVAAAESDGTVEFTADLDVSNHAVWSDAKSPSRESLSVTTRPLDDILAGEGEISLLKLDVEGAEMLALQGFRRHLEMSNPPVCIIEAHDHSLKAMGSSRHQVVSLLDEYDYSVWLFDVESDGLLEPPDDWNRDILVINNAALGAVRERMAHNS